MDSLRLNISYNKVSVLMVDCKGSRIAQEVIRTRSQQIREELGPGRGIAVLSVKRLTVILPVTNQFVD